MSGAEFAGQPALRTKELTLKMGVDMLPSDLLQLESAVKVSACTR